MWCIPEITPEYIIRMEDILKLYQKPYNRKKPVICFDEKTLQLLEEYRRSMPGNKSGTIKKVDSEYVRRGTANIFIAVEPKGGKHFSFVTKNRKGSEFAKSLNRLARSYPEAKKIHVILDNLNIHCEKSLTDYYGIEKGKKLV